jgi:hypothetical protein
MVQRSYPITRGGNTSLIQKKQERPLTGRVQNQRAAKGEERFSRTLEKSVSKKAIRGYYFRWTTLRRGTIGYRELDFLVFGLNGVTAISVKGTDYVHKNGAEKARDRLSELTILQKLNSMGINVREIKSLPAEKLETQEMADKAARELGVYR